jgi:hypothetical protein
MLYLTSSYSCTLPFLHIDPRKGMAHTNDPLPDHELEKPVSAFLLDVLLQIWLLTSPICKLMA